jgi:hypothetical protein
MKKYMLQLVFMIIAGVSFSQTATLRLQAPDQMPELGQQFLVGIWLDALENTEPIIKSAQLFIEFDGDVITPVSDNRAYHTNLNPILAGLENNPLSNSPFPGDLRFIILATDHSGIVFGGEATFPIKLWDIVFTYNGGKTAIEWGKTYQLDPVEGQEFGGVLRKGITVIADMDNQEYKMTLIDTSVGVN